MKSPNKMEKNLFPELKGEELTSALEANAFSTVEETIERSLSPQQREQYKDRLSVIQQRDMDVEEHLKEFCDPLKAERKDIKTETRSIVKTLKKGYVESDERVFWMQDEENKMMHCYDANGEFIKSRKMRPEERQHRIVPITKTGTDNE